MRHLDGSDAHRGGRFHCCMDSTTHSGLVVIGGDNHVLVVLVLDHGVGEPIAHGCALMVDLYGT